MRCPKCRCEIGTLTVCPYCGTLVNNPTRPIQPAAPQRPSVYRSDRSSQHTNRHISNIDAWSLACAVLLGGIFVMELLQVIILAMG